MLIEYNYAEDRDLDLSLIFNNLTNYLNSKRLSDDILFTHTSFDKTSEQYWVVSAYDAFAKYIKNFNQPNVPFSMVHHYHHFLDHKTALAFTLKMLKKFSHVDIDEKFINDYDAVVHRLTMLRNKILKCRIANKKIVDEFKIDLLLALNETKKAEIDILSRLLLLLTYSR